MATRSGFTIVIDSREQKPYRFRGALKAALPAGDYSAAGLERRVAVERKTHADCYSSVGAGRKRFEKEMKRLAAYDYAAIVIEAGLADFLRPPAHSRLHPHAAVNTLVSWSVKYGVHVFFAGSRRLARGLTYRIIEKFCKHRAAGTLAAGNGP